MGFRKRQPNEEFKSWHLYLMLAVLFIALVLGMVQRIQQWRTGEPYEEYSVMNQLTCEASGGVWENDACSCERNAQCPFSYECNQEGLCSEGSFTF